MLEYYYFCKCSICAQFHTFYYNFALFRTECYLLAVWIICIYLEKKKEKQVFLLDFLIFSLFHNNLGTGMVWNLFVHSVAHALGD